MNGEESVAFGHRFNEAELLRHTRRMLTDSRVRRLATEFTCQWLDIHEFDQNDEKSETRFPEFAQLRGNVRGIDTIF